VGQKFGQAGDLLFHVAMAEVTGGTQLVEGLVFFFFFFIFLLLVICAYKAWVISPPCPRPLPYHPLRPLPLPLLNTQQKLFCPGRASLEDPVRLHAYVEMVGRLRPAETTHLHTYAWPLLPRQH
jgi:hypothetical protein